MWFAALNDWVVGCEKRVGTGTVAWTSGLEVQIFRTLHQRLPSLHDHPVSLGQDASITALVGLAHAASHFAPLLLPLVFPACMAE